MSKKVHYSFYLESEVGVAAENLSPSFVFIKNIPDGISIDTTNIQINNLGDGLYSFTLDWTPYDEIRADGSRNSLFVKIETGLDIADQQFITMRVERQDYLPELVDDIQSSANSLSISADTLNTTTEAILRIEEGHWVISNHKLYIYDKSVTEENRTSSNASYIFNLFDASGDQTSQEIYQRININPEG